MKNISTENKVEFQNIDEFYLPENCIICGDETENRIEKSEYGSYTSTKDYKKDYKFKLPICDECNSKINLKAGKSGIILFLSVLLSISLGIIVYYLTYSIILSLAVFIVLFIFPYLNYRAKIRPRIKLSDFLHMKIIPNEELVQFTFINKEYARYVNKINSEKIKAKEIKAEKIKAEEIKEKEKSETVEKTPPLVTGKSDDLIQARESIVDVNIATDSAKPSTEEISIAKDAKDILIIKESKPLAEKCPKCGINLKPEWKFCVFCSEKIDK